MIDNDKKPSWKFITERDLRDDERLSLLFVDALRAGWWTCRSAGDVLTFWALAEKALDEAKPGTTGKLFYWHVKEKHH